MDAHFDARSRSTTSPRPESWQMNPVTLPPSTRSTPAAQSIQLPPVEEPDPTLADEPRSSFSPVSPKFAPIPRWKSAPRPYDVEFGRTRSAPLPPKAPRKCTDILFSWRVGGVKKSRPPPATFETWGPAGDLKITTVAQKRRRWRELFGWTLIVILLLYLVGNAVFIDIRLATGTLGNCNGGSSSNTPAPAPPLNAAATQCLFQFNLSAPLAPQTYPCGTCVPTLSAISATYLREHTQDAQVALDAQQFCGLQSLFVAAGSNGGAALEAVGWMQNNNYCTWSGISCDNANRVTSLTMEFPAFPATLPDEMGALTALTSLQIVGNGSAPAGALPSTMAKSTQLTTLHLEATALEGPISDDLIIAWRSLSTLTLIRNPNMGTSLPVTIGQSALQTLVVNEQGLTSFLLLSSSDITDTLQTLDLSANALSGPVYALFSAFTGLRSLHLSDNDFTGPLPQLPSGLQTLTLDHNPHFGGFALPGALCGASALTNCDMRDTLFSNQTTVPACGVCQF